MEISTDHPQVQDDMQEVNDRQTRRKIQNRLNQRASRRRKALLLSSKSSGPCPQKWIFYTALSPEKEKYPAPSNILVEPETTICMDYFCRLSLESRHIILGLLEYRVNRAVITRSLSSELLLPVTQLNIIHAAYTNATMMGLTMTLLAEDIFSPFNVCGPTISNLPPALQPTELQKSIIHHPWIDLCAVPSVRDSLLRNLHCYSEDELCHDLFSGSSDCNQPTGLVIWREAWEEFGYEISESIFRKWEWLWKECPQLLQSTNHWRSQRGEAPLVIAA